MPVYDSPVYPSIAIHFGDGKRARAVRGEFKIADEDVADFEKWAKGRPHYKISRNGKVYQPEKAKVEPLESEPIAGDDKREYDFDSMNVPTLRTALAEKGLDSTGNRPELIARLITMDDSDADDAAIAAADEAADADDE